MNIKVLVVLALCVVACNTVPLSRQKRTLGLISTGVGLATGALGTAASAGSTALKIGGGLLVGKTILLGLGGKYALYKYLVNKARKEGLNVGGTAGVALGPLTLGGSAGVGIGPTKTVAEEVPGEWYVVPTVGVDSEEGWVTVGSTDKETW